MEFNPNYKSGFVSILGKPNVGKSTFMNRVIGEKLSIVTPKPQTTRHRIKGIYTNEEMQVVFFDTPGYLKPRYELQEQMMRAVYEGINDCDLVIFMTDHKFPTDYDLELCRMINTSNQPNKIAVLNKCDIISVQEQEKLAAEIEKQGFKDVYKVSVINDETLTGLIEAVGRLLPFSPPLYPPEDLSDMPLRFFAAEIIREQIFLNFREEVPYSSTVTIEKFDETDKKVHILANVWLERKTQKIIFIGEKGKMIKKITQDSERELYKLIQKRVKVELWVKIKRDWRKKKNAVKEFGYYSG